MYLDPGFGGMLVQIIIAVVAAGGAILFAMRRKIKNLFKKNKPTEVAKEVGEIHIDSYDTIDMMDGAGDSEEK